MLRSRCIWLLLTLLLLLVLCANKLQATLLPSSENAIEGSGSSKSISSSSGDNNGTKAKSNFDIVGPKGKLIFAHVLYRHGDRTPVEPYPTDPWNNPDDWPTGWGQLTNIGKQQHFQLGQWLRQRYDSLLSRNYSKDEIYIRSTDVDRTLMSALSNLAGLYPPEGKDIWNSEITWQPIPVHTIPEALDKELAGKKPCPAFEYAKSSLLNSPEFQKLNDRYAYLYNYLSKYTGANVDSLEAIQRINNTLYIEGLYNKTLPDWTKQVYPSADMTYVSAFTFAINTYTRQMARLKTGPLIKEMFERFDEKLNRKLNPDRNVWIYSAHDTNVANLLNTLRVYDVHSPPYIACVMVELRLNENQKPFVSIFYKNTTDEPYLMNIPGCGTACPLNKMKSLYKDIIPLDWAEECKLSTLMMTYEEADIGLAMGILVAIIMVLLFVSYLVMIYYRRRSYRTYSSYSQVA